MSEETAVHLLVGTRKGAFVADSDGDRRDWRLRGPYLAGQNVIHMAFDPRSGILFAAVGDPWFGSRIYRSWDCGLNWDEPTAGPAFAEGSGEKLEKVWHVEPGRALEPGVVYAGVEPAALFKSTDDGATWHHVESLSKHPTRSQWQPGAGGLCLHTITLHPEEPDRIMASISAAGVFRTDDGGASWRHANAGTRANFMPDQEPVYPEWGQCVHKVVQNPARPERVYQQNHCGVYRSDDWGDSWTEITGDLPSDWGFPIAVHPHDPDTIYVCPGTSGYEHWVSNSELAVYRSRDAGQRWEKLTNGLPQQNAYVISLREGMAIDRQETPGVYLGTNTGQLFTQPMPAIAGASSPRCSRLF